MFSCAGICCSRYIYASWNWIVRKIYSSCCASRSDDLDEQTPHDQTQDYYSIHEDKHVIIELLNEYDN
jgi:hypothetical protein